MSTSDVLPLYHDALIRAVGSNAPLAVLPSPPGIPYELFIGFSWAGVGVATLCLIGRLYARFRTAGRFHVDDFFISIAYTLVLTTAALWQYGAEDMYYCLNVNAGVAPIEADFFTRLHRWLYVSFAVELLFYATLIMFKMSLLFFFRRLGTSVDNFNYLWWPILMLSLATFFVGVGDLEYQCYFGDLDTISGYCNSAKATNFLKITLDVNAALDVLTNFLIMLIPITLLWNVRIQRKKKIAIMGVFSLSLVTIAIAIARVADIGVTQKSNGLPDSTYLWFWSALQASLCIVVACSSAFRQLFTASEARSKKAAWSPTTSYYERLRSNFRSRGKKRNKSLYDISTATEMGTATSSGEGEGEGSHHDSEVAKLVAGEPGLAVCYHAAPSAAHFSGNQISHKREYQVTRHPV
ncbi:hypothetical protein F4802DRAFT_584654 [Xylaria palmicola]|nr:hypothetical protein F4802DRAFT_584654 [Xylaria palmicola]